MNTTEHYIQTWLEARTRYSNQLQAITQDDLKKRLGKAPNSAGFLLRHIADVELLFAKNVFGASELKVFAKSVAAGKDTGEWTNLQELLDYQQEAFDALHAVLVNQTDEDWSQTIVTKEFGAKTKAEAVGRIISHTAYHAGQLAIILKYGSLGSQ